MDMARVRAVWVVLVFVGAVGALGQARGWVGATQSQGESERIATLRALAKVGGEANMLVIAQALKDSSAPVRNEALRTLHAMKGPATFHAAVAAAPGGNSWELGHVLADYTDPIYVRQMIPLLHHRNLDVRTVATLALGLVHPKEAFRPIMKAAGNPRSRVGWEAAVALSHFDAPEERAALRRAATSRNKNLRSVAREALRQAGDRK